MLVAEDGTLAGYYTLATGQVDFGALPQEIAKGLPKRALPIAVLAWLGVDQRFQSLGLGSFLLAKALADCYRASRTFAFVAVVLDCLDASAKAFYERWDFRELRDSHRQSDVTLPSCMPHVAKCRMTASASAQIRLHDEPTPQDSDESGRDIQSQINGSNRPRVT